MPIRCYLCGVQTNTFQIVKGYSATENCEVCLACFKRRESIAAKKRKPMIKPEHSQMPANNKPIPEDSKTQIHGLSRFFTTWLRLAPKPVLYSEFYRRSLQLKLDDNQHFQVWVYLRSQYPRILAPKLTRFQEEIIKLAREKRANGHSCFTAEFLYAGFFNSSPVPDQHFRTSINSLVKSHVFQLHRTTQTLEFM